MSDPVSYTRKDSIAVISMDDGKVNALGPAMQQALNAAIDNADRDDVGALVITGNGRVFSGGFDLKILTSGEVQPAIDMLRGGFELAYRLLSYPWRAPVTPSPWARFCCPAAIIGWRPTHTTSRPMRSRSA